MNLNERDWAEFKVSDLFNVKYGVNLELNACIESDKIEIDSVNFVARTAENNGVSARVMTIDGVEQQKKGLISVASGGSVLSTFLQNEPFYSGRDLYTLDSKDNISDEAKMFIITIIEQNKYKYSYGRQANKTLPDLLLKLPINDNGKPDYIFMEDYIKSLHYKPLTTKNKSKQVPDLNVKQWKPFITSKLFYNMQNGKATQQMINDGKDCFYVGAKKDNNGIMMHCQKDESLITKGNCIVFICDGQGSVGYANYMDVDFIGTTNIVAGYNDNLNAAIGIFLATIYSQERPKYSFGRKWKTKLSDTEIKLPIQYNIDGTAFIDDSYKYSNEGYVPDWQFMERYIKSLPYGDRLEG